MLRDNRIIVEVPPTRTREKFLERISIIEKCVKSLDLPDAPLGIPAIHPIALASIALSRGFDTITHLRLYDVNTVGFKELVYAAKALGVDNLVILHGDKPSEGSIVSDLESEEAVSIIKKDPVVSSLRIGLLLSLRYPREEVIKRLDSSADFFLVLRAEPGKDYSWIRDEAKRRRKKLYAYLIIETSRNKDLIERRLAGQPRCRVERAETCILELLRFFDKIILSLPGDYEFFPNLLGKLNLCV